MEKVLVKTDLPHRFGQVVKTSVCDLNFNSEGQAEVTIVQAAKLSKLGVVEILDVDDYKAKVIELEKVSGKTIEEHLKEIDSAREILDFSPLQELLIKEREEKVSLLGRIQELEMKIKEEGGGDFDSAIKGLKAQIRALEKENEELRAFKDQVEKGLVEKPEVETPTSKKEEIEKESVIQKLDTYRVSELQQMCKSANLPTVEWEKMKKSDLVKYLADHLEE